MADAKQEATRSTRILAYGFSAEKHADAAAQQQAAALHAPAHGTADVEAADLQTLVFKQKALEAMRGVLHVHRRQRQALVDKSVEHSRQGGTKLFGGVLRKFLTCKHRAWPARLPPPRGVQVWGLLDLIVIYVLYLYI